MMYLREPLARLCAESVTWPGAWDRMCEAERERSYARVDAILPLVEGAVTVAREVCASEIERAFQGTYTDKDGVPFTDIGAALAAKLRAGIAR